MRLVLVRRSSAEWRTCVDLVRDRYASAFGADVSPDPDAFIAGWVTLAGRGPEIAACVGLTFGSTRGAFFSERYLDEEIDVAIERHLGARPERRQIVEVGSLASARARSGTELIRCTPLIAWCLGMQYILCTATQSLGKAFSRMGIPFAPFAAAERVRLAPVEQGRWGDYYEHRPSVGVIPLKDIAPLFSQATGRYSFSDPELTLLAHEDAEQTTHAGS